MFRGWNALLCFLLALTVASAAPGESIDANGPLNVRDFGAVGDGETDDTAAFQQALEQAAADGGNRVLVPTGTYVISDTLDVAANVTFAGVNRGASKLRRPDDAHEVLIRLEGADNAVVRDLDLKVRGYTPGESRAAALVIEGGSQDVVIENVSAEGFSRGFSVGRDSEESRALTFRNCTARHSRTWGFVVDHTQDVLFEQCYAFHSGLDGFKLRKQARNVTISGGESSHNGQNERGGGSGVDGYAGGDGFVIENLVVEHNHSSGIYVKTGGLFYDGFGPVRNGYISGVRVRYNGGSGIDLNRSGGDLVKDGEDQLPPLLSHVTISGGVFEENERSGIYVRGRNVTILGPISRRNGQHGIHLASAWDVEVVGAQIAGNGLASPGSFYGIAIGADPVRGRGQRVKVRGGTIDGIDSDAIAYGPEDENLDLEPTHRHAIYLAGPVKDVLVDNVTMRHWADDSPHPIRPGLDDEASVLVHYGHSDTREAVGGPGSTLVYDGELHVKASPVDRTDGWQPMRPMSAGPAEAKPEQPVVGQMHFDTDRGLPLWYDGSRWIDASGE